MLQHRAVISFSFVATWLLTGIGQADGPANPASAPVLQPALVERLGEEASRAMMQVYEYEATIPLEARVVEKVNKDDLPREKIVFRGAQGYLVPAYLQLPPAAPAPHACVLLLHGWSGSKENWWQDDNYISGGNLRKACLLYTSPSPRDS